MRSLLSRRDWVYLLSLLVPFAVYNLALKAANVISQPGDHGIARTLDLMRSDIFFNLGYALLMIGLFAVARRGPLRWAVVVLEERGNEPFMAEYFTGTGHYGYECLPNRYGYEPFSEEEDLDRYHNCLRMLDHFVENLIDQYKEQGLYEDTIFVFFGDHGEGFKEHGRDMHGDTIWDEGLKVPLIIHDPQRFEDGERIEGLSSQIDILPTVVDLLGYEVENGEYPGYSLLQEPPEDRTLMFSCITNRKCLAHIRGGKKYIYHYDDQPDEFYDLTEDPLEKRNLAGESGANDAEMDRRREELLAWRSRLNTLYEGYSTSTPTSPAE